MRILTIPFDPDKEIFQDEDLTRFLLNKRVNEIKSEFFQLNRRVYWTFFIDYESIMSERDDLKGDGFDEGQRLLYKKLREWRKEKGEKEGVPVYIIATNSQLTDVVRLSPVTLEALREINGFGKKKVDNHGKEIVAIIQAFYEKRPVKSKNQKQQLPSREAQ